MLFLRIIWKIFLRILLWFLLLSIISVIIFKFVMVPITPLMITRCAEHVMDGKTPRLKKDWVSIDEMSKSMPLAAMCAEDQHFLTHHGFDFEESFDCRRGEGAHHRGGFGTGQRNAEI